MKLVTFYVTKHVSMTKTSFLKFLSAKQGPVYTISRIELRLEILFLLF